MENNQQEAPYAVDDVIRELVNTNANLTLQNAELRAIITKLEKENKDRQAT